MIRRLLPAVLSMTLLGPVLAGGAGAQEPSAAGGDLQGPAAEAPAAKDSGGRIAVTRSDGSTGLAKPPDQKEVRKLVSYMRDGMNRADRADRQKPTRRAIQYKKIWIRR